jgi:hypothetical protein
MTASANLLVEALKLRDGLFAFTGDSLKLPIYAMAAGSGKRHCVIFAQCRESYLLCITLRIK